MAFQSDDDPRVEDLVRALITWLQNWRAAPRERSKAADWALVVLTLLAATAAVWSAYIFQDQLTEARKATAITSESFRIDERAWVTLDPIKPLLIAPADEKFPSLFVCEIFLKNLGKTAARDVSVKAKETSGPEGYGDRADILANFQDKFLLNQFKVSGTDNPVIVPKNPVPKVLAPNSASPVPFRLTCAAPKVYPGGLQWMNYMIGRVDYCDQFKVKHWLKFCFYVVNARGEVWACQAGNDEDRNTETTVPETTCDNPG